MAPRAPRATSGSRVPRGELRAAMIAYLREHGGQARTLEIHKAVEERLGRKIAQSSVRSGLQKERYFERVQRGEFKLQSGA